MSDQPDPFAFVKEIDRIGRHYDRNGVVIGLLAWGQLFANADYKRVARTTVTDTADPAKTYDVSTIWIGVDHNWGVGAPLIFETMVFGEGSDVFARDRYSTEPQAREGHTAMVITVSATLTDPVAMDATEAGGSTP